MEMYNRVLHILQVRCSTEMFRLRHFSMSKANLPQTLLDTEDLWFLVKQRLWKGSVLNYVLNSLYVLSLGICWIFSKYFQSIDYIQRNNIILKSENISGTIWNYESLCMIKLCITVSIYSGLKREIKGISLYQVIS